MRDWSVKGFLVGLMMLVIVGCTSTTSDGAVEWNSFGQEIADQLVIVQPENRDLRICLIAAGAVEVMTDLAQRGGNAQLALGNLTLLQNAIDKARNLDSLWVETDAADVSLIFAKVLKDAGKSRLSQILLGGPTIQNFIGVANRAFVLTVKGNAVMKDINSMLWKVESGELQKVDAWLACLNRLAMNRTVLQILNGGHVSSTETMIGTQTELGFLRPLGYTEFGGVKTGIGGGSGNLGGTETVELDFVYPFEWKPIYLAEGWGGLTGHTDESIGGGGSGGVKTGIVEEDGMGLWYGGSDQVFPWGWVTAGGSDEIKPERGDRWPPPGWKPIVLVEGARDIDGGSVFKWWPLGSTSFFGIKPGTVGGDGPAPAYTPHGRPIDYTGEFIVEGWLDGGTDQIYWPPGSTSFVSIKPGTVGTENGLLWPSPRDWIPIASAEGWRDIGDPGSEGIDGGDGPAPIRHGADWEDGWLQADWSLIDGGSGLGGHTDESIGGTDFAGVTREGVGGSDELQPWPRPRDWIPIASAEGWLDWREDIGVEGDPGSGGVDDGTERTGIEGSRVI